MTRFRTLEQRSPSPKTKLKIKLTQRECDQLLRSANVQPNGYVKYEEFVKMITMPLPEY